MRSWRKLALLLIVFCFSTAMAQEATCGPFVQQALSAVENDCASTGRNQACYGYVALDATPRDGVQNFNFAREGDVANVADVETLRLSALDQAKQTWGIALMKLQANLPDTLPGQNVTFLMFGNVEVTNAVPAGTELKTVDVTSKNRINVRSGPSTNYGVIGSLGTGDIATANGRNEQTSWLRIQLPGSSALGWVSASLVSTGGDLSSLSVFSADDHQPAFKPMQAFYFSTGIGKSACNGAPQDGILIQTPEGAGKIALRANDVDIQLGSTGYFQASAGADMSLKVIEGEGKVTANGQTVTVPAGAQVAVPVDQDMKASGPPGDVEPYSVDDVANLPVDVLPRQITVADPASQQDIDRENGRGGSGGGTGGGMSLYGGLNVPPGMDICAALAQAGMSGAEYRAMLDQIGSAMAAQPSMPGVDTSQIQAQIEQVKQMVAHC